MAQTLVDNVAAFCKKNHLVEPNDHIIVGVSGGPDSLCLLNILRTLAARLPLTLTVAHLNHQLRGTDSTADEEFVRHIAAQWQLPCVTEQCNIADISTRRKQSLEEAARQVRYAFLWRTANAVGANKIAVGHNADDQVETILMHFLRGTGLSGLRGMLPSTDLGKLRLNSDDLPDDSSSAPQLIRPLLETSRTEIETYCREQHLEPRHDHTNQDTTLFRNRLRHELIPLLETYNPNIRQVLPRTAKVVTADVELLNQQVDESWQSCHKKTWTQTSEIVRIDLDLACWRNLPLALQRAILRRAIQILRSGLRDILFEHIETAVEIIQTGGTGAQATLPQSLMLTVGYDQFSIADTNAAANLQPDDAPRLEPNQIIPVSVPGITVLPHSAWQLVATVLTNNQITPEQAQQAVPWETYLDADTAGEQLALRPRQPGDIFCPLGLGGRHKKVNEFMIDQKIPVQQRKHIPLLVNNNQVLWICGYRPSEQTRLRAGTKTILHISFEQKLQTLR